MNSSSKLASGDLIEYRQLKAKAGGTGDGGGSRPPSRRFRAGEEVTCKIAGSISRGYQLSIEGISNSAFLRTDAKIEIGAEIVVQFVCVYRGSFIFEALIG